MGFQRVVAERKMPTMPFNQPKRNVDNRETSDRFFQLSRPHELHLNARRQFPCQHFLRGSVLSRDTVECGTKRGGRRRGDESPPRDPRLAIHFSGVLVVGHNVIMRGDPCETQATRSEPVGSVKVADLLRFNHRVLSWSGGARLLGSRS